MAILSTTTLTFAESKIVNDSIAAKLQELNKIQKQVNFLGLDLVMAVKGDPDPAILIKILANRNPVVPVPMGARISRQIVHGVDTLVVTNS